MLKVKESEVKIEGTIADAITDVALAIEGVCHANEKINKALAEKIGASESETKEFTKNETLAFALTLFGVLCDATEIDPAELIAHYIVYKAEDKANKTNKEMLKNKTEKETKTKCVQLRLKPSMFEALEKAAGEEGRSINNLIEKFIEEGAKND